MAKKKVDKLMKANSKRLAMYAAMALTVSGASFAASSMTVHATETVASADSDESGSTLPNDSSDVSAPAAPESGSSEATTQLPSEPATTPEAPTEASTTESIVEEKSESDASAEDAETTENGTGVDGSEPAALAVAENIAEEAAEESTEEATEEQAPASPADFKEATDGDPDVTFTVVPDDGLHWSIAQSINVTRSEETISEVEDVPADEETPNVSVQKQESTVALTSKTVPVNTFSKDENGAPVVDQRAIEDAFNQPATENTISGEVVRHETKILKEENLLDEESVAAEDVVGKELDYVEEKTTASGTYHYEMDLTEGSALNEDGTAYKKDKLVTQEQEISKNGNFATEATLKIAGYSASYFVGRDENGETNNVNQVYRFSTSKSYDKRNKDFLQRYIRDDNGDRAYFAINKALEEKLTGQEGVSIAYKIDDYFLSQDTISSNSKMANKSLEEIVDELKNTARDKSNPYGLRSYFGLYVTKIAVVSQDVLRTLYTYTDSDNTKVYVDADLNPNAKAAKLVQNFTYEKTVRNHFSSEDKYSSQAISLGDEADIKLNVQFWNNDIVRKNGDATYKVDGDNIIIEVPYVQVSGSDSTEQTYTTTIKLSDFEGAKTGDLKIHLAPTVYDIEQDNSAYGRVYDLDAPDPDVNDPDVDGKEVESDENNGQYTLITKFTNSSKTLVKKQKPEFTHGQVEKQPEVLPDPEDNPQPNVNPDPVNPNPVNPDPVQPVVVEPATPQVTVAINDIVEPTPINLDSAVLGASRSTDEEGELPIVEAIAPMPEGGRVLGATRNSTTGDASDMAAMGGLLGAGVLGFLAWAVEDRKRKAALTK